MQVQITNTVDYTTATKEATKTNRAEATSNVKFDISSLESKNPKEITYDEYKKLDKKDIEQLFPKESMPEENKKAMALHTKVNISDDEILNQVLFEKELEVQDYEIGQRALGMIDFLSKMWDFATSFESIEKTEQYMKENNIPFSKEVFMKIEQKMEKTVEYDYDKKMTAEELFEIFDKNKLGYEAYIEFYNYTQQDEKYQEYQANIAYRESIKIAYEQKQNEQNATLDAYTRNTKPNPVSEKI